MVRLESGLDESARGRAHLRYSFWRADGFTVRGLAVLRARPIEICPGRLGSPECIESRLQKQNELARTSACSSSSGMQRRHWATDEHWMDCGLPASL